MVGDLAGRGRGTSRGVAPGTEAVRTRPDPTSHGSV
jgi:hypothetical protein